MSSCLAVRGNGLFLFISFEDRGVHKSVFQDYFKTNQITGKGDYAKIFHGKYWGSLKRMSDEDH